MPLLTQKTQNFQDTPSTPEAVAEKPHAAPETPKETQTSQAEQTQPEPQPTPKPTTTLRVEEPSAQITELNDSGIQISNVTGSSMEGDSKIDFTHALFLYKSQEQKNFMKT